ncbi:MAG: 23S rRNA (pseudouridine(1915)-N(3))-methyltransferase RlmH [Halieaceae bacterium]|jgi:23S rRNA (pseudouridine1915-N3)-methyltransferase|nr:23S rRNA (pseudouridine(1915)-N(3))-methyltransferase RlmH [Halieaceae bacterium]
MRITIVAVGSKMPSWIEQGVTEYGKRMPPELKLRWREVPMERRGKTASAAQLRVREGERILRLLPASDRVIALEVEGQRLTTARLAQQLTNWQMSGDNYSFLIGGPDGLSAECLERAHLRWSLSDLTLPHPLVRVLLAEQLYRAWTITINHPYHRD